VDVAETGIGHTVLENILDKIILFLSMFGDYKITDVYNIIVIDEYNSTQYNTT